MLDYEKVLLMWRYRFITDSWGWEIPNGKVDDGKSLCRQLHEKLKRKPQGARTNYVLCVFATVKWNPRCGPSHFLR